MALGAVRALVRSSLSLAEACEVVPFVKVLIREHKRYFIVSHIYGGRHVVEAPQLLTQNEQNLLAFHE